MAEAVRLVEVKRGDLVECWHAGHAVIVDSAGHIGAAWGDPEALIYPRSSAKMIQALPLAEAVPDLPSERLALASASHTGTQKHSKVAAGWLADLEATPDDLVCGQSWPADGATRADMIRAGQGPAALCHPCSGKHTGFVHLHRLMEADGTYNDPDGDVQREVRKSFEEVTGDVSPMAGIDGCAVPTFACTLTGLARAAAAFAGAEPGRSPRDDAMIRLHSAMRQHPDLVAGDGRPCTELMRASGGRAALKMGNDGVYLAILPDIGLGIAVKIMDGALRASQCVIAALLAQLGVLDPANPAVTHSMAPVLRSPDGREAATIRAVL